jgi:hypothetical protein
MLPVFVMPLFTTTKTHESFARFVKNVDRAPNTELDVSVLALGSGHKISVTFHHIITLVEHQTIAALLHLGTVSVLSLKLSQVLWRGPGVVPHNLLFKHIWKGIAALQ